MRKRGCEDVSFCVKICYIIYGRAEVRVLPFKTCLYVKQIVNLEATYYLRLIVQEVAVKSEMGGEKNLEPQVARGVPPVTRLFVRAKTSGSVSVKGGNTVSTLSMVAD